MVIQIGKLDEDSFVSNGGWDAFIASENRIVIKAKPYYKIDGFGGSLLAGAIFITAVEFFVHDKLINLIFLILIALFILALLYITVLKPLKSFKGFEIEFRNGALTVNNKIVSEVCIFAVCDPDDNDFDENQGFWGMFGFDGNGYTGGRPPSIKIGFQFKTNNEIFYARGNLESSGRKGMEVIFDFLLKNKIKISYKYKEIRDHLLCLRTEFNRFENEFDLDNIKQIETDVQGERRYIRKGDKYPSDGVLKDQINNK